MLKTRTNWLYFSILLLAYLFINLSPKVYAVCGGPGGGTGGASGSDGTAGCAGTTTNHEGGGGGGGGGSRAGGNGTAGAGGGLLLENTSGTMTVSGTVDVRGGGNSTTNGGTVKLFYTGTAPSTSGISSGRTYSAVATSQISGTCTPQNATDDASSGTLSWSSPFNALVQDGQAAGATTPGTSNGTAVTHNLVMTNCNLTVPSTATITGIRADMDKYGLGSGDNAGITSTTDSTVKLVKSNTIQGNNKASGTTWNYGTAAWSTYGSSTDLWGVTLTPSDVNSTTFGVSISASMSYYATGCTTVCPLPYGDNAYVDATHITVYYTIGASNSAPATPTLSSPSSGATGVGLRPTWQLRTSDADNDYLKYKIDLCQDAACATVLQTFDQTSSQTGWSGQDANGNTAYVGSSSISGSTMANYTAQSSLSQSTTYYWRGYAIDPGGNNAFTSPSSIQSFTTGTNATPSAPSLLAPTSGATSVSTSPLLQIRSTDADGDYLRYKILLYNSDCSTGLQTFDQTSSQTGWSGQDQQAGTAYTGGSISSNSTVATYGSASLSSNTQYCWKAAAIDPAGTNTWSAYSSTQLFTTGSAVSPVQINGNTQINGGTLIR